MGKQQGFRKLAEVQQQLGVSRWTLYEWLKDGRIQGVKLPSGHYRVPEAEVKRLTGQAIGDGQRKRKENSC